MMDVWNSEDKRGTFPAVKRPTVLVIAPHTGDEVLGCGVAIQKHVAEGSRVVVIFMSSGRAYGNPHSAEADMQQRDAVEQCCEALGVSEVCSVQPLVSGSICTTARSGWKSGR